MSDIIVKKSKINNKGVFANRKFKKGEVVLNWNPKVLKASEAKKIPVGKRHYVYKSIDNKYFLMQSLVVSRQINHFQNIVNLRINIINLFFKAVLKEFPQGEMELISGNDLFGSGYSQSGA